MKRCEMIIGIENKLSGALIDHDNFGRQILDTVEELGMEPPRSEPWYEDDKWTHVWEPEDV